MLCTAAVPTVLAALHAHMVGNSGPAITNPLVQGFLASCACACGDTFASEVGMLSGEHPKSILSLQRMRAGTNGAVTLVGTLASGVGGGLVGVVFCGAALVADASAYPLWQSFLWRCLSVGLLGGVIGTTLDSFLGATVQFSGFVSLSNSPRRLHWLWHCIGAELCQLNPRQVVQGAAESGVDARSERRAFEWEPFADEQWRKFAFQPVDGACRDGSPTVNRCRPPGVRALTPCVIVRAKLSHLPQKWPPFAHSECPQQNGREHATVSRERLLAHSLLRKTTA